MEIVRNTQKRWNDFFGLVASLALIAVLIIDARTIAGHDSLKGGVFDNLLWWAIAIAAFVTVLGLQASSRFYARRQGGKWMPPTLTQVLSQLPVWCRCVGWLALGYSLLLIVFGVFGTPSHVHNGLKFYPSGRTGIASPEEVFQERAAGVALISGIFIQIFAYPALYFISRTPYSAANNTQKQESVFEGD